MRRPNVPLKFVLLVPAVIAVALAFLGRDLYDKRVRYLHSVRYHSRELAVERVNLPRLQAELAKKAGTSETFRFPKLILASRLRIEYHLEMVEKYSQAAWRPWEPVAPDPEDPGNPILFSLDAWIDDSKVKEIEKTLGNLPDLSLDRESLERKE